MLKRATKKIARHTHDLVFKKIHGKNLIYNSCWEDPRIDRQLMRLDSNSSVVMITSAGCNALDYLLDSPKEIHTVDMNPRQNALLEFKMAMIRRGNFDELFALFGKGFHPEIKRIFSETKELMSEEAANFWEKKLYYFDKPKLRKSFYYHGAAGNVAWIVRQFLKSKRKLRRQLLQILEADTSETQRDIYNKMEPEFWSIFIRMLVRNPIALAMLGVPRPQILLIKKKYPGGMVGYVKDKLRHVFCELPLDDNYFWRVYLTGSYTHHCCPNYLKKENLPILRKNLDRIKTYTGTFSGFLKENPAEYTHFVLLDHQDWLAAHDIRALEEEWDEILKNSRSGSKILMRSASMEINFLPQKVNNAITPMPEISEAMHKRDRVGTYASILFAEVK